MCKSVIELLAAALRSFHLALDDTHLKAIVASHCQDSAGVSDFKNCVLMNSAILWQCQLVSIGRLDLYFALAHKPSL